MEVEFPSETLASTTSPVCMKTQKADTDIFTAVIASDVIGYLWVVK
jgi:hypothetical protein